MRAEPNGAQQWLVPSPSALGTRAGLVCFPYAGGGASVFHGWQQLLPELDVYAVRLPGRESRLSETPWTSLRALAHAVGESMEPLVGRPLSLFGHSMGGWLAFEVARWLEQERGVRLRLLVVSACLAPRVARRSALHLLPDTDLVESMRARHGTPDGALDHPELVRLMLPTVRADLQAVETHSFVGGTPLGCALIALYGTRDVAYPLEAVRPWTEVTAAPKSAVASVAGGHFFVNDERNAVARLISSCLAEA